MRWTLAWRQAQPGESVWTASWESPSDRSHAGPRYGLVLPADGSLLQSNISSDHSGGCGWLVPVGSIVVILEITQFISVHCINLNWGDWTRSKVDHFLRWGCLQFLYLLYCLPLALLLSPPFCHREHLHRGCSPVRWQLGKWGWSQSAAIGFAFPWTWTLMKEGSLSWRKTGGLNWLIKFQARWERNAYDVNIDL